MATTTFAAAVLLPEWRHLQALQMVEQAEADRADRLEARVADQRRHITALTTDPAAMARLAQRELTMVRDGEIALPIRTAHYDPAVNFRRTVETDNELHLTPPAEIRPSLAWDRIFCDNQLRPIMIALSIALAGTAFALFGASKPS